MSTPENPTGTLPVTSGHWIYLIIACIAIPAMAAFNSYFTSREQMKIEYVKIALGILQPQKEESAEQRTVLETLAPWAVSILSDSSPIALSENEKAVLRTRQARFSFVSDFSGGFGGTYDAGKGGFDAKYTPSESGFDSNYEPGKSGAVGKLNNGKSAK